MTITRKTKATSDIVRQQSTQLWCHGIDGKLKWNLKKQSQKLISFRDKKKSFLTLLTWKFQDRKKRSFYQKKLWGKFHDKKVLWEEKLIKVFPGEQTFSRERKVSTNSKAFFSVTKAFCNNNNSTSCCQLFHDKHQLTKSSVHLRVSLCPMLECLSLFSL